MPLLAAEYKTHSKKEFVAKDNAPSKLVILTAGKFD